MIDKTEFFKRQTTLFEIGETGQQKLQNATVLVVGCGGLGSTIAVYLATSGIGTINLIDFDTVSISNLHRQVFFTLKDVGKPKVTVLAKAIKQRAPFTTVNYTNQPLTKETVFNLIETVTIVVDGTDSLPTKYLLNDACVLQNKPLVYGSLYKFDGYVASFNVLQKNETFSANLRDAFPEMATEVPSCEVAGTLNSIVGIIATQQVNEVLKLVTGIGKPLINELLVYNSLENTQLKMKLKPTVLKDKIKKIFKVETYFDALCETQNPALLITAKQLETKFLLKKEIANFEIIAVLPNLKFPFKIAATIPIQSFRASNIKVDFAKTYILVCKKGLTSYLATKIMKNKYPELAVFSLVGGASNYNNDTN